MAADVSETVSFRASPAEKKLLEEVAEHQLEKVAPFVRRAALQVAREYVDENGGVETVVKDNLERRQARAEQETKDVAQLLKAFL